MPNLSALSRGTQVLAAAGLLLLIDTFLPWQDFAGIVSQNAWNGFLGVVMGLMLIALLAWVIARIMDVKLPVEVPDGLVTVALGGLIFLFALIKNLDDAESTLWSYIGVLLAAGVAAGAWLRYQEAGGTMETLKASLPARQTESPGTTGTTGAAARQTETETEAEVAATPTAESAPPPSPPVTHAGPTTGAETTAPAEPSDETETERRPPESPSSSTGPS